jgi:hypothetical protein
VTLIHEVLLYLDLRVYVHRVGLASGIDLSPRLGLRCLFGLLLWWLLMVGRGLGQCFVSIWVSVHLLASLLSISTERKLGVSTMKGV